MTNRRQQPHRLAIGLTQNIFQRLERKLTASSTNLLGLSGTKMIDLEKGKSQADEAGTRPK